MNSEVLIPGLRFIKEQELTPKEVDILIYFLEKPYTTSELAEELKMGKHIVHHFIQRLKLRKILVFKSQDKKGNKLFEFNKSIIED